jgi:translation elongation factor EF-Tu-like GTPase
MAGSAEVLIRMLPAEEGGRRTGVCLSTKVTPHYRPHLRVVDGDGEMLGVEFVHGPDNPVQPGATTRATVRFAYEPAVCYDALVVGAKFQVLEGSRVVGIGEVTRR